MASRSPPQKFTHMTATEIRRNLREIQAIHEQLGDDYLELCKCSDVEPLSVVWQTFPPQPDGDTQAYVMRGYDIPEDPYDQAGWDVHGDNRAELVHNVFLRVLTVRCAYRG